MTLPNLDPTALRHSAKLTAHIRAQIQAADGAISFARFMELALYAPGLGYYSAGAQKLGKGGDFVTAPEISPLFARSLANQFQQILMELGHGDILELGAGSGLFAKDLLLTLETVASLPDRYFILEISADLRERQQQLLQTACPHLFSRVIWLESLPTELTGIIVANEVADAMPVTCFSIVAQTVKERCVGWENNAFFWQTTAPTTPALKERGTVLLDEFGLPDGYASEINLALNAWVHSLADSLKKGVILLLDYGYERKEYYRPDRNHGTLMCFYQHRAHDNPFVNVGLQDITAHVDFTAVVESGIMAGLNLGGYTTQAGFLLACGLLQLAASELLDPVDQYKQSQALKTLTLPAQMGELIKVVALTKDYTNGLLGFELQDRRRDL